MLRCDLVRPGRAESPQPSGFDRQRDQFLDLRRRRPCPKACAQFRPACHASRSPSAVPARGSGSLMVSGAMRMCPPADVAATSSLLAGALLDLRGLPNRLQRVLSSRAANPGRPPLTLHVLGWLSAPAGERRAEIVLGFVGRPWKTAEDDSLMPHVAWAIRRLRHPRLREDCLQRSGAAVRTETDIGHYGNPDGHDGIRRPRSGSAATSRRTCAPNQLSRCRSLSSAARA